ncbi:MAG: DNA polymerase, partial [Knoellia sp.]
GEPLRTFGGRLIPTGRFLAQSPVGTNPALDAARGRFARNAIIQGAAAELFKAWAATVRALGAPMGAQIVLCLHDELLVHAPESRAPEVAALVDQSLADASRRWAAGAPVRFVADTSVIARWSDAKP